MDLRLFFDQVDADLAVISDDTFSLRNQIRVFKDEFPALDNTDIVLFGIEEDRGSSTNKGSAKAPDLVRKNLYALKRGFVGSKIADIGNLRPGQTQDDTVQRLREVCAYLLSKKIIPIIIGGSQDLDYGQFLAYESTGKMLNILNVDSRVDMSGNKEDLSAGHVHKILVHQPNIIFNYAHMAYQSYLVHQEVIDVLEKLHFESYRVGRVRENIEEMEPVIRDADMLTFDIGAIRQSDAPANANACPFGLSGEEACQIAWYAGQSNKISSFGIYEINPELDLRHQTTFVAATMIWYFIEGFYHRKAEADFTHAQYVKYHVSIGEGEKGMVFYKNTISEKWWMELPIDPDKKAYSAHRMLPCSYSDYINAGKGEVPDRWILANAKMD